MNSLRPGPYVYSGIEFKFEPFYVGKGTGNRIKSTLNDVTLFKYNKINKILSLGGEIIVIKFKDLICNDEAIRLEIDLINKIGRRDINNGPLVNQTNGGDGRLSSSPSVVTRQKISNSLKSLNLTFKHKDETKEYLRLINLGELNPMYGKTHSVDVCESQSIRVSGLNHPMYGKTHSVESINKIVSSRNISVDQSSINIRSRELNSKVVNQFSLSGDFIMQYESIKIASIKTGLSESLIGKTCRGVVKNPRKFIFKFNEDVSIFKNSYLYKIGDSIRINGIDYILVKRNKKSCVVSIDGVVLTIRRKLNEFIWDKNKY